MSQQKTIELEFAGQKIALKCDGDSEIVQEAVALATLRLQDVERRAPGTAAHKIALVALLDLAEEYIKAKRRAVEHKKKLEKKAGDLFRLTELHTK